MEKREQRIIIFICCLISFSAMNIAMFNVARPDIAAEFRTRYDSASWVVTVFGILYAAGAAAFISAAAAFMMAVNFSSPWLLVGSAALAALFVLRQQYAAAPFIPPELFRSRVYRTGLAAGFLKASVNFGILMLAPILLGEVYAQDAGRLGLLLFPGAAASSLVGLLGGRIIDRKGVRIVLLASAALTGSGLLLISTLTGRAAWGIASALVLTSSGYILAQPALAKAVSASLAEDRTGIGMSVYSLGNFLSTALGGLAVTKALEAGGATAVNPLSPGGATAIYSNIFIGLFIAASL